MFYKTSENKSMPKFGRVRWRVALYHQTHFAWKSERRCRCVCVCVCNHNQICTQHNRARHSSVLCVVIYVWRHVYTYIHRLNVACAHIWWVYACDVHKQDMVRVIPHKSVLYTQFSLCNHTAVATVRNTGGKSHNITVCCVLDCMCVCV